MKTDNHRRKTLIKASYDRLVKEEVTTLEADYKEAKEQRDASHAKMNRLEEQLKENKGGINWTLMAEATAKVEEHLNK